MNIKYVVLFSLFVTSIMAAAELTGEQMAKDLIAAEDDEVEKTFTKFETEQSREELRWALVEVAKSKKHVPKAVRCLEITKDPYPKEESRVSRLVHDAVEGISVATHSDAEAFATAIASFNPDSIKPLASIRYEILKRNDAMNVLQGVMEKSPTLIIDNLPRWLATHGFDPNTKYYSYDKSTRKQIFKYLISFATESILKNALAIAKKNEHYTVDSDVQCCTVKNPSPSHLINKLETLLKLVQGRKALLNSNSNLLPNVLIDIVESYLGAEGLIPKSKVSKAIKWVKDILT